MQDVNRFNTSLATRVMSAKSDQQLLEQIKDCIADPSKLIRLDDLVAEHLQTVILGLDPKQFPADQRPIDVNAISERLQRYDEQLAVLSKIVILLGRWGSDRQLLVLNRIMSHLADANTQAGGITVWLGLRWYPFSLLQYYGGIASLSSDNYGALRELFVAKTWSRDGDQASELAFSRANSALADANDAFKLLPEYQQMKVPRSEVMYARVRPRLEELVFLGSRYEELFDRFELFNALMHVDRRWPKGHPWGPPGRFAWKTGSPLVGLRAEAEAAGEDWIPLRFGFFQGSLKRFREVSDAYGKTVSGLSW